MGKTVQKIVINSESIDVISVLNGVNNVTQLSLDPQENEMQRIFLEHNVNTIINYPFDMRIVRGLAENEEQLKDYLETCRRSLYSKGKRDIPSSIPKIEYDLRELKDSDLMLPQKIEMFKKAKETQNILGHMAELKIGILDRGYFTIQEFLQDKNKTQVQALNAGMIEDRRNLRKELYNPAYTKQTNTISKEYALQEEKQVEQGVEEVVR